MEHSCPSPHSGCSLSQRAQFCGKYQRSSHPGQLCAEEKATLAKTSWWVQVSQSHVAQPYDLCSRKKCPACNHPFCAVCEKDITKERYNTCEKKKREFIQSGLVFLRLQVKTFLLPGRFSDGLFSQM